jgi:hypothetical protein
MNPTAQLHKWTTPSKPASQQLNFSNNSIVRDFYGPNISRLYTQQLLLQVLHNRGDGSTSAILLLCMDHLT